MGVIIELSYRTGAPHCTNDLLIQTSPKKNTDDPSYRQVAASNAGPRDRGANVQLQNPSWWDATEDAPPAECQVEQLIAGAVHHWEKPSTRAIFTRETNHWLPLLICWYNHWYTSLTLCSVGKTIFENHERGKRSRNHSNGWSRVTVGGTHGSTKCVTLAYFWRHQIGYPLVI